MKKVILIAALVVSCAFADANLSAVLQKYTNSPVEIYFEQKTYWAVREKETKIKGKILIGQGGKFNISVGKMNFISDGKTYWEYNSRQKQVKVQKIAGDASKLASVELLDLLKTADFIENKSDNSFVWQDAKSLKNGYEKVTLFLTDSQISKVIAADSDKNVTTYVFEKTAFPAQIPESSFKFVIPEGTQVYED